MLVTELDEWQPDIRDATKLRLVRDPKVWRMASVPLQLTTKTYTVNQSSTRVTARALSSSTRRFCV